MRASHTLRVSWKHSVGFRTLRGCCASGWQSAALSRGFPHFPCRHCSGPRTDGGWYWRRWPSSGPRLRSYLPQSTPADTRWLGTFARPSSEVRTHGAQACRTGSTGVRQTRTADQHRRPSVHRSDDTDRIRPWTRSTVRRDCFMLVILLQIVLIQAQMIFLGMKIVFNKRVIVYFIYMKGQFVAGSWKILKL